MPEVGEIAVAFMAGIRSPGNVEIRTACIGLARATHSQVGLAVRGLGHTARHAALAGVPLVGCSGRRGRRVGLVAGLLRRPYLLLQLRGGMGLAVGRAVDMDTGRARTALVWAIHPRAGNAPSGPPRPGRSSIHAPANPGRGARRSRSGRRGAHVAAPSGHSRSHTVAAEMLGWTIDGRTESGVCMLDGSGQQARAT